MLSVATARPMGVTMIELLIALTIVGFLLALGVPAMATYLQNAKVSSAAQNLSAGLALARAEAIRRNMPVEFVLTNANVAASGVQNAPAANVNGINWLVRAPDPAASGSWILLDAKSGLEGEAAATPAVQVAASGTGGTVTFNAFGGTLAGNALSFEVSNPAGGTCAAASGPMRCKRVMVSAGGRVRTCDPAVADATDTRACVGP